MSAKPSTHAGDSNQEQQGADSLSDMYCSQLSMQEKHTLAAAAPDIAEPQTLCASSRTAASEVVPCLQPDTIVELDHGADTAHTVAVETDSMLAAGPYHGLLERVPGSWLHQLLRSLPRTSKAAAFATSRWLAKHVMEASPSVALILCGTQPLTPKQTQARRRVLTHLLSARRRYEVGLYAAAWQPFPISLAYRVTSLTSFGGTVAACCNWAAMRKLSTFICQHDRLEGEDVIGLCAAVEAGQMQQLHTLHMPMCAELPHVGRLVSALAAQLLNVNTICEPFMEKLHQFAALKSFTLPYRVQGGLVPDSVMRQLCEHPTLRHLTIGSVVIQGDHSRRSCSWDTLTMHWASLDNLALMPLSSVQQLQVMQGLLPVRRTNSRRRAQAATIVFPEHILQKTKCIADSAHTFLLRHLCPAMLPLAERMSEVKVVRLSGRAGPASVLSSLYRVLPVSVESMHFEEYESSNSGWFDVTQLWQGLPQHVTSIDISMCDIADADLSAMVHTTPAHVKSLVLRHFRPGQRADWMRAGLSAAAPNHLKLQISLPVRTALNLV